MLAGVRESCTEAASRDASLIYYFAEFADIKKCVTICFPPAHVRSAAPCKQTRFADLSTSRVNMYIYAAKARSGSQFR